MQATTYRERSWRRRHAEEQAQMEEIARHGATVHGARCQHCKIIADADAYLRQSEALAWGDDVVTHYPRH